MVQDDTPGNPKKLSDKATSNIHISAVNIEGLSDDDNRYMLEVAYGDSETVVVRHRFVSGVAKKLAAVVHSRIRACFIPAGEEIYYRMMCEVAGATCEVSIRYHPHE